MIRDVLLLGLGMGISYGSSYLLRDGILGGVVIMTGLLLTLRGTIHDPSLHPVNAWVALSVLGVYALIVLALPRCYLDRYGSRFCRETNPDGSGFYWMTGLMVMFFLMGCIVIVETISSSLYGVGQLGLLLACISIIGVGIVEYGQRSVPITSRENQHLYIRGAFVDTLDQSVRVLPGYTKSTYSGEPAYLGHSTRLVLT